MDTRTISGWRSESGRGHTRAKADAAKWEAEIAKRRYAIIVDEAHSSQSGETARELKAILGKRPLKAN